MGTRRSLRETFVVVFLAALVITFALSALDLQVGLFVRIVMVSALMAAIFSLMDRRSGGRSGRKPKSQAYYSDRR